MYVLNVLYGREEKVRRQRREGEEEGGRGGGRERRREGEEEEEGGRGGGKEGEEEGRRERREGRRERRERREGEEGEEEKQLGRKRGRRSGACVRGSGKAPFPLHIPSLPTLPLHTPHLDGVTKTVSLCPHFINDATDEEPQQLALGSVHHHHGNVEQVKAYEPQQ